MSSLSSSFFGPFRPSCFDMQAWGRCGHSSQQAPGCCISAQVEVGYGFTSEERHTRPADVLAANWMMGKPAAFDFTVTSPLTSSNLPEASVTAGSAAFAAEERKHKANDSKCAELGWVYASQ